MVQVTPVRSGGTTVQVEMSSVVEELDVQAQPQSLMPVAVGGQMASTSPFPFCPVKFSRYCAWAVHTEESKIKRKQYFFILGEVSKFGKSKK